MVRILLDYCSKHLDVILKNKVSLVLYFGVMIRGVRQGVVANTEGQSLLASPGALTGARGVEVDRYGHKGGQDASGSRRRDQLRTPGMVQSASRHGVEPRILEPYGSPHQGHVNPFWREGLQRSVRGHDDRPAVTGNDGSSGFDVEIEKLKETCLRDAEEAFACEVKKLGLGEKTEAESYHTVSSSKGAQNAKAPNGSGGSRPDDGLPHGAAQSPEPPPGLASARIGFDGTV